MVIYANKLETKENKVLAATWSSFAQLVYSQLSLNGHLELVPSFFTPFDSL